MRSERGGGKRRRDDVEELAGTRQAHIEGSRFAGRADRWRAGAFPHEARAHMAEEDDQEFMG